MEILEEFKRNLVELNYPRIESFSLEDVAVLFSENKFKVVEWVLKQLPFTHLNLDKKSDSEKVQEIVKFMNDQGLCSFNDSQKFAQNNVSPEKQVEIISRIFYCVTTLKSNDESPEVPEISVEKMEKILNLNIDSFQIVKSNKQSVEDVSALNDENVDYDAKIKELQAEIDGLLKEKSNELSIPHPELLEIGDINEIKKNVDAFISNVKMLPNIQENNPNHFGDGIEVIKSCADNVSDLLRYYESKNESNQMLQANLQPKIKLNNTEWFSNALKICKEIRELNK